MKKDLRANSALIALQTQSSKKFLKNQFQKDALLNDLTAAESEVDQAAEDTRCQSSLL